VSAGFDAHVEDDMASLRFTEADYAWVTERIKKSPNVRARKDRFRFSKAATRSRRSEGA